MEFFKIQERYNENPKDIISKITKNFLICYNHILFLFVF